MKIVGLSGKAGAGKDYVYETLNAALSSHKAMRRMAFADGIKTDIEESTNGGRSMLPLWTKPYSHEVRTLIQWWGTEFRRNENINYWVEYGADTLKYLESVGTDIVCITDVRFQNEVDLVHRLEGVVFNVAAPDSTRARRLNVSAAEQRSLSAHATERGGLQNLDGTIDNILSPIWPESLNQYLGLHPTYQPLSVGILYGQS